MSLQWNVLMLPLLEKQVTRKEFLMLAAMVLLSITGIKGILEILDDSPHTKNKSGTSFGSGSYGL